MCLQKNMCTNGFFYIKQEERKKKSFVFLHEHLFCGKNCNNAMKINVLMEVLIFVAPPFSMRAVRLKKLREANFQKAVKWRFFAACWGVDFWIILCSGLQLASRWWKAMSFHTSVRCVGKLSSAWGDSVGWHFENFLSRICAPQKEKKSPCMYGGSVACSVHSLPDRNFTLASSKLWWTSTWWDCRCSCAWSCRPLCFSCRSSVSRSVLLTSLSDSGTF